MNLSQEEIEKEKSYLKNVTIEIKNQIKILGKAINLDATKETEFRRYLWEAKGSMDAVELKAGMMDSEQQANIILNKMEYYKKLFKIEYNPYFGRVDFTEEKDKKEKIYIGITHVTRGLKHLVYDWRSPISSLFYDYGTGPAEYIAPKGQIKGLISLRRQYKIEKGNMVRIFDNDLNVVDECLQEVLATQSTDKMKNIVNTIQQEQNEIIRDISNKHLIVQGIAGSGKTSVALHRIAFLLYKLKNLNSNNVLIFSPNNVFTEYISSVLPELGENNTLQTTYSDFAKTYISEYQNIESFTSFIERYYTNKEENVELVKFKLSRQFKFLIDEYANNLIIGTHFTSGIESKLNSYSKEDLNYLLKKRYSKLPLFERIEKIAEYLCDYSKESYSFKKRIYMGRLFKLLNNKRDFKKIYNDLWKSTELSKYFQGKITKTTNYRNIEDLNYEDTLGFIYLKGLLEGFPYSNSIEEVVIDEAQDYNYMQYFIMKKIFKKAGFTILGDVNQTVNPYHKYDSLEEIKDLLDDSVKYIELNKTYRSSSEIIEYTNDILKLEHSSAIRRASNVPVIFRKENNNLKQLLIKDINDLKEKYASVAIITKNEIEAEYIYNLLENTFNKISLLKENSEEFNKSLIIIPSYISKGLEFDSVIAYINPENKYTKEEKYLFYVVCTRTQHQLIVYN